MKINGAEYRLPELDFKRNVQAGRHGVKLYGAG